MPPQRHNSGNKEGRLLLAIHALKSGIVKNPTAAARLYDVSRRTLISRMNGRVARAETRANGHILTSGEEEVLTKWLLDIDDRGYLLTPNAVRSAALLLLKSRLKDSSATIGVN